MSKPIEQPDAAGRPGLLRRLFRRGGQHHVPLAEPITEAPAQPPVAGGEPPVEEPAANAGRSAAPTSAWATGPVAADAEAAPLPSDAPAEPAAASAEPRTIGLSISYPSGLSTVARPHTVQGEPVVAPAQPVAPSPATADVVSEQPIATPPEAAGIAVERVSPSPSSQAAATVERMTTLLSQGTWIAETVARPDAGAQPHPPAAEPIARVERFPFPSTSVAARAAERAETSPPAVPLHARAEQQHADTARDAAVVVDPMERTRKALEDAKRQMPGLLDNRQAAQRPSLDMALPQPSLPVASPEWPGVLQQLRETRQGISGNVADLRGIVSELQGEVTRLVGAAGALKGTAASPPPLHPPIPPSEGAALGEALPRLYGMLERLRALSPAGAGGLTPPRSAAPAVSAGEAGATAASPIPPPVRPPVRVEIPRPEGAESLLPGVIWPGTVPHTHTYAPDAPSHERAPAADAAAAAIGPAIGALPETAGHEEHTAPSAAQAQEPQPAGPASLPLSQSASSQLPRAISNRTAVTVTIFPVEGIARLSALERRLAGSPPVQRLELTAYRRGEATFRASLAGGATVQDIIQHVPDTAVRVVEVLLEDGGASARVRVAATAAAAPASA